MRLGVFPTKLVRHGKKIKRLSIGVVALGAMLADSGPFPMDAFNETISVLQRKVIGEVNYQALEAGAAMLRQDCV